MHFQAAMSIPALLLLAAGAAAAQPLTFGVKAGVPFIDPYGPPGESLPFSGGGSVELRLPARFGIEASALYRRIGQSYSYTLLPGGDAPRYSTRFRGNSWEFPMIGKYYFRPRNAAWQPFVGAAWRCARSATPSSQTSRSFRTRHSPCRRRLPISRVAPISAARPPRPPGFGSTSSGECG